MLQALDSKHIYRYFRTGLIFEYADLYLPSVWMVDEIVETPELPKSYEAIEAWKYDTENLIPGLSSEQPFDPKILSKVQESMRQMLSVSVSALRKVVAEEA